MAAYSNTERQAWISVAFEEIDYAKPVIASASLPIQLGKAFINALPDKWRESIEEEGFDLAAIAEKAEALDPDASFIEETLSYRFAIKKVLKDAPTNASANYLIVHSNRARVPIPLMVTSVAVRGIQFLIKEFQGKDAELTALIEEIRKMPPTVLYREEDALDQSWMEIRLE